jgi:hypothetical protein
MGYLQPISNYKTRFSSVFYKNQTLMLYVKCSLISFAMHASKVISTSFKELITAKKKELLNKQVTSVN